MMLLTGRFLALRFESHGTSETVAPRAGFGINGRKRRGDERALVRPLLARALDDPPVFQEELGKVKTVSVPAALPIRCETSRGRDRISVPPRCGIRPPEGG
jgi:hypothetical protein